MEYSALVGSVAWDCDFRLAKLLAQQVTERSECVTRHSSQLKLKINTMCAPHAFRDLVVATMTDIKVEFSGWSWEALVELTRRDSWQSAYCLCGICGWFLDPKVKGTSQLSGKTGALAHI
jgi:hypothetical protein